MEKVSKYSNAAITSKLNGKRVHFTSDCSLFPNFDVIGKVISCTYSRNKTNVLFITKLESGRTLTIDSKMSNLKFELL